MIIRVNHLSPEIKTDGAYLSLEDIARYFEISVKTFQRILERQPEVMTSYQKAKVMKKLQYHKLADAKIIGDVTEGDTSLLIFQLKTRCRMSEAPVEIILDEQKNETEEQKKLACKRLNYI